MIIKTQSEIEIMKKGGEILSSILNTLAKETKPGISTKYIDARARELVSEYGVKASFLGYDNFPAAICVSINEEIVHGVPSDRIIEDGDLVKIDMGVFYRGYHTDSALTLLMPGGEDRELKEKLVQVTKKSLAIGISNAKAGNTLGDIGAAIQEYVEANGFNVVRDLVGHGIGRDLHEDPQVFNYGSKGRGPRLTKGAVLAIEPMVVLGDHKIKLGNDGFSYITKDSSLSAHFEHTIAITDDMPLTITL